MSSRGRLDIETTPSIQIKNVRAIGNPSLYYFGWMPFVFFFTRTPHKEQKKELTASDFL